MEDEGSDESARGEARSRERTSATVSTSGGSRNEPLVRTPCAAGVSPVMIVACETSVIGAAAMASS